MSDKELKIVLHAAKSFWLVAHKFFIVLIIEVLIKARLAGNGSYATNFSHVTTIAAPSVDSLILGPFNLTIFRAEAVKIGEITGEAIGKLCSILGTIQRSTSFSVRTATQLRDMKTMKSPFVWLAEKFQGRHTFFIVACMAVGTTMAAFHRLDGNLVTLLLGLQGMVLGHSAKDDYFQRKVDSTQPPMPR